MFGAFPILGGIPLFRPISQNEAYLLFGNTGSGMDASCRQLDLARPDLLTSAHMPIFAFGKARTIPLSLLAPPLPLLPPRALDRQKPSKPGTLHIAGEFGFLKKARFVLLSKSGSSSF